MDNSIYSLTSGLIGEFHKMNVTSNNIANANTSGYKEDKVIFSQRLTKCKDNEVCAMPYDLFTITDFTNGSAHSTGNRLDFMISGEGFFMIDTPNGIMYTKQGNFSLNSEGVLVTSQGYPVLSADLSHITIEQEYNILKVHTDGNIYAKLSPDSPFDLKGKIGIGKVDNLNSLRKTEHNMFASDTQANVIPGKILQGTLEQSNANPVLHMRDLVEIQERTKSQLNNINDTYSISRRAYEIMSKSN